MAARIVFSWAAPAWLNRKMLPEYPHFEPLDATCGEKLAPYFALAQRPICDLSFANLCIWRDCEKATFTFIDGHLCIYVQPHEKPAYFLEPLGQGSVLNVATECLRHAERISHASEALVHELPQELFQATALRDHFDYFYRVEDLAELKGSKHDGKRNQIRKFIRRAPEHHLVALADDHIHQVCEVFEQWSRQRSENSASEGHSATSLAKTACQLHALKRAFEDFQNLGLQGLAVCTQDRMHGFILGSQLNAETAVVHFLYADSSLRGIYQFLLQEACRTIFSAYHLINLEEDLGIAGLRRTKMSYNPLRLEQKFLITPRSSSR
jgi:hypothetical protein